MMRRLPAALLLLIAAACASAPDESAPAAGPMPVAPDARLAAMQTQMTELLERIDVLNDRIARLEESRLSVEAETPAPARTVETRETTARPVEEPTAAPRPAPQPTQKALAGAQIADDYRQAMILFGSSRHADARRAFESVFEADPNGELADNALFWIGETWFAAGNFANAMRFYARVVNEFSDQNKAPDAMLKMAVAQAKTGDLALARKTLQQVIERYPYSTASSSAKAELERIRF